jgi:hypothetical protein
MSLHIYTYSTSDAKAKYLFESANVHMLPVENLATTKEWTGFRDKLSAVHKKIETLPDTDIVCFLDAYDIIVNADADTIHRTFMMTGADIVFGAETTLDPPSLKSYTYPESSTRFRYLNSGAYIGYVHALKSMFTWENYMNCENDQEYVSRYFLENYTTKRLFLDTKASFVLNMHKVPWSELVIEKGLILCPGLSTSSCFLHFNRTSHMDVNKDYVRQGDVIAYDITKLYERTFHALLTTKVMSYQMDVKCLLTGRGATY